MKIIKWLSKNEKGATLIETIILWAFIGTVVIVLAPSIQQMFVGTNKNNGIATNAIHKQIVGFDESAKGKLNVGGVEVIPGCDRTLVESEECDKLTTQ